MPRTRQKSPRTRANDREIDANTGCRSSTRTAGANNVTTRLWYLDEGGEETAEFARAEVETLADTLRAARYQSIAIGLLRLSRRLVRLALDLRRGVAQQPAGAILQPSDELLRRTLDLVAVHGSALRLVVADATPVRQAGCATLRQICLSPPLRQHGMLHGA